MKKLNKILSIKWFKSILGFIHFFIILHSVVFDTKQPPKPNIEQFFMKRQKWAINPNQCGESCELEFSKIGKSAWIISRYGQDSYHLEIDATDLKLSSDFDIQIGNGDFV
ncbi:hypothetical protein [Spiroplasma endosymbiont of 'Nebria riversi']|uniref:hypothetical protein n=1 Tax=Spiroplasma endosymbiont of 'Nebria riversi' TaxID=2792084 RepID=UPI001C0487FB|nr:hypothetical protein [Spiroplasma endosymbiont of 'Nebria riversi']